MQKTIVVASHLDLGLEELDYPYLEVFRTDEKADFKHNVYKLDGINSPTLTWSEYSQFFYPFPLEDDVEVFGLVHYRCMLDLENKHHNTVLPYSDRKAFFDTQASLIDSMEGKIVIANPLECGMPAWNQLVDTLPYSPEVFLNIRDVVILACKRFDQIVGGVDSERMLKSTDKLYYRNIFIAPKRFAENWYHISKELLEYLDTIAPPSEVTQPPYDRWGAFILERLFSVFVMLHMEKYPDLVVIRPLVFFN